MKKKILIIEDDAVLRENTAELLKLAGYEIMTADNGRSGIAMTKAEKPDLILCDIKMDGADGYSVLHAKARDQETAGIPFIFITGKSSKADLRKGMELGADDFLFKPFEEIELLRAIETRISKHEQQNNSFFQSHDKHDKDDNFPLAGEIRHLLEDAITIDMKKGELLYRQDNASVAAYYIIKGKIKTYYINNQGKAYITRIAGAGEIVGFKAVIENRGYRQIAEAIVPSLVKRIPADSFRNVLFNNRQVAGHFVKLLSKQLSEKEQELMEMAYSSVRYRVGRKLLEETKNNGGTYVDVPKVTLAQMIGTTSETLVRTLNEFKCDNLIRTNGKKIYIDDVNKLEQIIDKY